MLTRETVAEAIRFCESEITYYRIADREFGLNDEQKESCNNFKTALEALREIEGGLTDA